MTKESTFEKLKEMQLYCFVTKKLNKVLLVIFPGKFTRKSRLTQRLSLLFVLLTGEIVSFFKTNKSGRQTENLEKKNFFLEANILHLYRAMFCTCMLWSDFIL